MLQEEEPIKRAALILSPSELGFFAVNKNSSNEQLEAGIKSQLPQNLYQQLIGKCKYPI